MKFIEKKSGFSLIQTIVAIVILALSLSATITLVTTVLNQTDLNKKRITGTYLAQECLELVRNIRDSAWKQNLSWNCGFSDEGEYLIQSHKSTTQSSTEKDICQNELGAKITTGSDGKLFLKNGVFTHDGSGKETPFERKLIISDKKEVDSKTTQITATCKITWDQKNQNPEIIEISEVLSNWQKK